MSDSSKADRPASSPSKTVASRVVFAKPALTLDEQVALLSSRGLVIADIEATKEYLQFIGYYRLSGYFPPFQATSGTVTHQFKAGTTFEQVLDVYVFDRKLRVLLIDAIERIEVAVRGAISNTMALKYGPHWFLDPQYYRASTFDHPRFLSDVEECMRQNKSLPFIQHYRANYEAPPYPPCWMTFEILPFGKVSFIYKSLASQKDRQAIAMTLQVPLPNVFESWIHSISYLRNLCAHHSRVWNKKFTIRPTLLKSQRTFVPNDVKLYAHLVIIHSLLKAISPDTGWAERLKQLCDEHPNVSTGAMGFPQKWDQNEFWFPKEPVIPC